MKYYILKYKEDSKLPHSGRRKDKPLTFSATFLPLFLNQVDAEFTAKEDFNDELYIQEVELVDMKVKKP